MTQKMTQLISQNVFLQICQTHSTHSNRPDPVTCKKYIVFETCLDSLFNQISCIICMSPVSDINKEVVDSSVRVSFTCSNEHKFYVWESQPKIGNMPSGNLLLTAATCFSGNTFAKFMTFSDFLNLQSISKTTFYTIQSRYIIPTVEKTWFNMQEQIIEEMRCQDSVRLCGDDRCDSPVQSSPRNTVSWRKPCLSVDKHNSFWETEFLDRQTVLFLVGKQCFSTVTHFACHSNQSICPYTSFKNIFSKGHHCSERGIINHICFGGGIPGEVL